MNRLHPIYLPPPLLLPPPSSSLELVGAGGNAGNQAAVKVIRGLATGEITGGMGPTLRREAAMGFCLGGALFALACVALLALFRDHGTPSPAN